ncbi:hypothetical protein FNV43_RR12032 [Rhamnella rubrinervis]|uniref:CRAL-TRIO domain-containing protein n=1 Tax=Rhamnella rubrinervis TaxID=2594499 RepID=A0A8K0H6M7_9ROSA|nr:hypothetical protein FNV43_RR12032 [Rhamnella rubrinervis]
MSNSPTLSVTSLSDQQHLIEKNQVFKIQGRDKHGHRVLQIIGKFFPGRAVSSEGLNKYLENRVVPEIGESPFSVLYVHTGVQGSENFSGASILRAIYEAFPVNVKDQLEAVYFVHPGLQTRLYLATIGRLVFRAGLYKKLKYVNRLEFLWDHVRRNGMEIPEFVYEHDRELEYRPMLDYGLESDYLRVYGEPSSMVDLSLYSMRCIAQ